MNSSRIIFLVVFLAAVALCAGAALAERDDGRGSGGAEQPPPQADALYAKECGACHLAYPPQFLPKRSWEKIMGALDRHFGENASLDEAARTKIRDYLAANSAETGRSKTSRKILSSIRDSDTPLRISETPYFRHEHDEVRPEVFERKSVVSPANCGACHTGADKGDFDEDRVRIPKN